MKKIIVSLFLAFVLSLGALASGEILFGTPAVDGLIDEAYNASYKLEQSGLYNTFYTASGGQPDGSKNARATAYYLYDDSYLYIAIDVTDEKVFTRGEDWIVKNIKELAWENDAVEARIYYPELGDAKQANQYIFQCDALGIATTNYRKMCKGEHWAVTSLTEKGYVVEFKVPLSFGKKAGDSIGLSIEIDDIHEEILDVNSKVGGHNFNAFGSQHPYDNMVTLGEEKAALGKKTFNDTKNHWSEGFVSYVAKNGLFEGTDKGFEPDSNMTRAMFVTVLGRAFEKKGGTVSETSEAAKFTDVDYSAWYGKYVDWAVKNAIVKGDDKGKFNPDVPVTREEMAIMLFRFSGSASSSESIQFADGSRVSPWAKTAVSYAATKGLINGKGNNLFCPKDYATRAEVAAIISRYMQSDFVKKY